MHVYLPSGRRVCSAERVRLSGFAFHLAGNWAGVCAGAHLNRCSVERAHLSGAGVLASMLMCASETDVCASESRVRE